jgi:iron-sulfur cluster repair protein YtfE (RIC family)
MNDALEFPTLSECEPQWLDRPVSAIASHISRVYHEYSRDKLPLIADVAARVRAIPGTGWNDDLPELVWLLAELLDAIETHACTEDDLLFPVLVAHEYPNVLETSVGKEELVRLVDGLAAEHVEIRRLISEIDRLTNGYRVPDGAPGEFEDLVRLVEELTRSLTEELNLEDRCLLPRARQIASR